MSQVQGSADRRPEALLEGIVEALATRGLTIVDDFLPPLLVADLAREARELWSEGGFRGAGIGQGANLQQNAAIRTDRILWLNPATASPARCQYLASLDPAKVLAANPTAAGKPAVEEHQFSYRKGKLKAQ